MITLAVPRWCRAALCAAAVLLCARPAVAEWQFAPFFGWEFGGHTSLLDLEDASDEMHRAFGITVTRLGRGPIGFETTALYVPGFFDDPRRVVANDLSSGSRAFALMGNVVLVAPLRWNEYGLRPYVSGGVGLLHAKQDMLGPDAQVLFSVSQPFFAGNIGGGAVGFITDRTGLRFDLRFFSNLRNLADTEAVTISGRKHLRFWTGSIGLVLR